MDAIALDGNDLKVITYCDSNWNLLILKANQAKLNFVKISRLRALRND